MRQSNWSRKLSANSSLDSAPAEPLWFQTLGSKQATWALTDLQSIFLTETKTQTAVWKALNRPNTNPPPPRKANGLATNPTSPTPQSRKAIPALPPSSEGHTSPTPKPYQPLPPPRHETILQDSTFISASSLYNIFHFVQHCSILLLLLKITHWTKKQKIIFRNKLQNKLHTKDKIIEQLSKACSKNQLLNQ